MELSDFKLCRAIKVDKSECVCVLPSGCEISRSKYRLPKPITGLIVI